MLARHAIEADASQVHECEVKDVILRTRPADFGAIAEGAALLACPVKGRVWCRFKVREDTKKSAEPPLMAGDFVAVWHPEMVPLWLFKPLAEWLAAVTAK